MADNSIEKELPELETRYWQAIKDKDFDTALSFADAPCLVVGPGGVMSVSREEFRRMMQSATHSLSSFQLKDWKVTSLTNDVAVVAYNAHEEKEVDGKTVTVDASHSSTWVRRNGRWTCPLHTESIAG